jgi:hypothetical protein
MRILLLVLITCVAVDEIRIIAHHITNERRIIQSNQDNCTQKNDDDVNLLRAQMRAHTQGRFNGRALIYLFHSNVLVTSYVKIHNNHRALKLKAMKHQFVVCILLTLLLIFHRRIGTSVLDERRHIGRVNFVGAGYHCY